MDVYQDYEDLFKILNAYKIKYLLVGGYAFMYYAKPRYTKDIDIWIIPQMNDSSKIYQALKEFGVPLRGIKPQDFSDEQMILQIGVAPLRIDVMLSVTGLTFKKAWQNRKRIQYGKTPVYVVGKKDLIAAKIKLGRPQDKLDLEYLK